MRAADTNVLVRIIVRDDPEQAEVADDFVRSGAWVSHVVLAEVAWTLGYSYEMDAMDIATGVEMFLGHESLVLQDPDVVVAALARFRAHPAVGFADCLILEVARKAGHLPLGTFDRGLGKLDGTEML